MISTSISGILANHEISAFVINVKLRAVHLLSDNHLWNPQRNVRSGLAVSEAELYESM